MYGNIVALDESPLQEDLIYVGTDDGLIQILKMVEKLEKIWNFKVFQNILIKFFGYIPTFQNRVYAVLNNHKRGDFHHIISMTKEIHGNP